MPCSGPSWAALTRSNCLLLTTLANYLARNSMPMNHSGYPMYLTYLPTNNLKQPHTTRRSGTIPVAPFCSNCHSSGRFSATPALASRSKSNSPGTMRTTSTQPGTAETTLPASTQPSRTSTAANCLVFAFLAFVVPCRSSDALFGCRIGGPSTTLLAWGEKEEEAVAEGECCRGEALGVGKVEYRVLLASWRRS